MADGARAAHDNYLHFWIEMLMSGVKHWHKYKSVVRVLDFLVCYSLQCQLERSSAPATTSTSIGIGGGDQRATTSSSGSAISQRLLSEMLSYVKADFGIGLTLSSSCLPSPIAQPQADFAALAAQLQRRTSANSNNEHAAADNGNNNEEEDDAESLPLSNSSLSLISAEQSVTSTSTSGSGLTSWISPSLSWIGSSLSSVCCC